MKRVLLATLLLCSYAFLGCSDDNSSSKDKNDDSVLCESLHCDHEVGGYPKTCVVLNGKASCQQTCAGNKSGLNAAICWTNPSIDPLVAQPDSIVDTCALDDNGKLYSKSRQTQICSNGCDDATGTCMAQPVAQCPNDCKDSGGRDHVCTLIQGKSDCKPVCHGDIVGETAPFCSTMPGATLQSISVIDTCAADDLGTIYLADTQTTTCSAGCDNSVGICIIQEADPCEALHCDAYDGGRQHVCAIVNGQASCKPKCMGTQAGENSPVCYENPSLPPEDRETLSIVDICALDDMGTLYSSDQQETVCENGCFIDDGLCAD